jgi:hypothetical protein
VLLQRLPLGECVPPFLPPSLPPSLPLSLPHAPRMYALVATSVDGTPARGCTTFYVRPDVEPDIEPAKVADDFHRWYPPPLPPPNPPPPPPCVHTAFVVRKRGSLAVRL